MIFSPIYCTSLTVTLHTSPNNSEEIVLHKVTHRTQTNTFIVQLMQTSEILSVFLTHECCLSTEVFSRTLWHQAAGEKYCRTTTLLSQHSNTAACWNSSIDNRCNSTQWWLWLIRQLIHWLSARDVQYIGDHQFVVIIRAFLVICIGLIRL